MCKAWSWYKNDTIPITVATNETFIEQFDKNYYLIEKELHFW